MEMEKQQFDADSGNLSYIDYIRYIITILIYRYMFCNRFFIYKCIKVKHINKAGITLNEDEDKLDELMTRLFEDKESRYWLLSNYISSFIVLFAASGLFLYGMKFIARIVAS